MGNYMFFYPHGMIYEHSESSTFIPVQDISAEVHIPVEGVAHFSTTFKKRIFDSQLHNQFNVQCTLGRYRTLQAVVAITRSVPSLHPGVNDLIRVLGKQAHCASRTLILCEPRIPAYSRTSFHKHCSPKRPKSLESLSRYSSLWSPIQPSTYYYDCFFYDKYPDRELEYQNIDKKYSAIKKGKYDYSQPQCSDSQIQLLLLPEEENDETESLKKKHKDYKEHSQKEHGGTKYDQTGKNKYYREGSQKDRGGVRGEKQAGETERAGGQDAQDNEESVGPSWAQDNRKKSVEKRRRKGRKDDGIKPNDKLQKKYAPDFPISNEDEDGQDAQEEEESFRSNRVTGARKKSAEKKRRKGGKEGRTESYDNTQMSTAPEILISIDGQERAVSEQAMSNAKRKLDPKNTSSKAGNKPGVNILDSIENDDCVPCEDVEELQMFKDLTSIDIHQTLDSAKNTTAEVKESFMKIVRSLDPSLKFSDSQTMRRETLKRGRAIDDLLAGASDHSCPAVKNIVESVEKDQETVLNRLIELSGEANALSKLLERLGTVEQLPSVGIQLGTKAHITGTKPGEGQFLPPAREEVVASTNEEIFRSERGNDEDCVPCDDIINLKEYKGTAYEDIHNILTGAEELTNKLTAAILEIVRPYLPPDVPPESFVESIRGGVMLESNIPSRQPENLSMEFKDRSCVALEEMAGVAREDTVKLIDRLECLKINSILLNKLLMGLTEMVQDSEREKLDLVAHSSDTSKRFEGMVQPSYLESEDAPTNAKGYLHDPEPVFQQPVANPKQPGRAERVQDVEPDKSSSSEGYQDAVLSEKSSSSVHFQDSDPEKSAGSVHDIPVEDSATSIQIRDAGPSESSRSMHDHDDETRDASSSILDQECETEESSTSVNDQVVLIEDTDSSKMTSSDETTLSTTDTSDSSRPVSRDGGDLGEESTTSSSAYTCSSTSLHEDEHQPKQAQKTTNKITAKSTGPKQMMVNINNTQMSLLELMEITALLTDAIILEAVSEMMEKQKYIPPSRKVNSEGSLQPVTPKSRETSTPPQPNLPSNSSLSPKSKEALSAPKSNEKLKPSVTGKRKGPDSTSDQLQAASKVQKRSDEVSTASSGRKVQDGTAQPIRSSSPKGSNRELSLPAESGSTRRNQKEPLSSGMSKLEARKSEPSVGVQPVRSSSPKGSNRELSLPAESGSTRRNQKEPLPSGKSKLEAIKSEPSGSVNEKGGDRLLSGKPSKDSKPRMQETSERTSPSKQQSPKLSNSSKEPRQPAQDHQKGNLAALIGKFEKEKSPPDLKEPPNKVTPKKQADQGEQGSNKSISHGPRRRTVSSKPSQPGDDQPNPNSTSKIGKFEKGPASHRESPSSSKTVARRTSVNYVCDDDAVYSVDYEVDGTILYYARISGNAFPPVKESFHAAGFMLKSAYDYTIPPRGKVVVKTDLRIELPPLSYGRLAPRKCLVENYGIDVGTDVIDRDCRENITVLLFNHSDNPFLIKRGTKVAQLICETIHYSVAKENCDLLN